VKRPLVILTLILPALALQAAEKRERIAVLEVAIEGDAPPELRAQIGKSVDAGLRAAGLEVVARDEVAGKLRNARSLVGCFSTTCLARIGNVVGAKRFLRARVEASGAAYTLELELLAADAPGGLVERVERNCPVCTLREVTDLAGKAAVELVNGRTTAHVSIDTQPPGAQVSIDGVVAGDAPVETDLDAGAHDFRATLPRGYRPADARRQLVPGERAEVLLELAPEPVLPAPAPRPVETASRFGAWKWAAAGGAVALVAGGVALLALDGGTTDCSAGTPCKSLYDTKTAGIAALVGGAALGGLSAYLFLNDRVAVTTTATAVSARLSF